MKDSYVQAIESGVVAAGAVYFALTNHPAFAALSAGASVIFGLFSIASAAEEITKRLSSVATPQAPTPEQKVGIALLKKLNDINP